MLLHHQVVSITITTNIRTQKKKKKKKRKRGKKKTLMSKIGKNTLEAGNNPKTFP